MPLRQSQNASQMGREVTPGIPTLSVRQIAAVVIGNALEFYDFGTY
jgi:hypothetical protein